MTKFETMDNMTSNVVALTDQELMETEGGGFITGFLIVSGVIAVGVATTYVVGAIDGYNQAQANSMKP